MLKQQPGRMNLQLFAGEGEGGANNQQATQQQTQQQVQTQPATNVDPQKLFTEDYVKSLRGEAAENRVKYQALKKAVQDTFGVELQGDLVQELAAIKANFEQQVTSTKEAVRNLHINTECAKLQAELGIIDLDAALQLADLSKVEVAEDGKVTGLDEALKAVLEAKPYLKGQVQPQNKGSFGGSPVRTEAQADDGVAAALKVAQQRNQQSQAGADPWVKARGQAPQSNADVTELATVIAQAVAQALQSK